jgi:hypothetical protein
VIALVLSLLISAPIGVRRVPGPSLVSIFPTSAAYYQLMPSGGEQCSMRSLSASCQDTHTGQWQCSDPISAKNNKQGARILTVVGTTVTPGPWKIEADVWCSTVSSDNCPLSVFPSFGAVTQRGYPTGLTATSISSTEVVLSWTDNAIGEREYVVYRSLDNINWEFIGFTGPNTTTFHDCWVLPATVYHYAVNPFYPDPIQYTGESARICDSTMTPLLAPPHNHP